MPSSGADSRKRAVEHITSLLVIAAANVLIYREYWSARKIFSGKDFLTAFHLLLNFQSDCLQQGSWPLWNPFMNFGYPYVEHYINSALFPTHLLMGLTGGTTVAIIQWEMLSWIILGGFGIYLCAREFGLSSMTGVLAGTSFMACGQITALPQWSTLVYNAACFPFLLLGYHRAKARDNAVNPISIAFLTLSILGGYIVSTVLGMYLFAGYVLLDALRARKGLFALRYLATTFFIAAVLSLPKLLPLYLGMDAGPRMAALPASGAPLDTFNIITPYNFLSLLLPVKFYFSLFLGTLCVLAVIHAAFRLEIRFSSLGLMTLLSGWLLLADSQGQPSLLHSLASVLPFMRLVRNDWLSWFYPSIFALLFAARHIETFLADRSVRARAVTLGVYLLLISAAFFTAFNFDLYREAYGIHLALATAWCSLAFLARSPRLHTLLATALILIELSIVFTRVNVDVPPQREDGRVLYTVIDQRSVSPSLEDSNEIRAAFPAIAVQDQLRPGIDDARRWPVLRSGLDGDPAYNLYPGQYGKFIDAMNLKRFSGWWYNTQEHFDFIRLKDSPLLTALDGQPLFMLIDRSTGVPQDRAVSFDGLTCSSFSFTVHPDGPSFLLLRQMFDARWSVRVDSTWYRPKKAEDFFMGVPVGPGTHSVQFIFRDPFFTASLWISGLTLTGLIAFFVLRRLRSRRERLLPVNDHG